MRHPLRDRLRRETSNIHQTLEIDLNLLNPELTLEEYRTLLEGFYGFYAPWEDRVAGRIDELLPQFTQERRKAPMLERDLRFLRTDPSAIPRCPALPDTSSTTGLLGSLYVLEGAILGGQILSRHFLKHFGLSRSQGCCFFSSYGGAVGPQWQAFCARLASYSSPETDSLIVQSAIETFGFLAQWLGHGRDSAILSIPAPNSQQKSPEPTLRSDPGTC